MKLYHLNYSRPYDMLDFIVTASCVEDAIGLVQTQEESMMEFNHDQWELNTINLVEGAVMSGKPRIVLEFSCLC